MGEKYVLLNVLGDTDLETVKDLVPATDTDYSKWDDLVLALVDTDGTVDRENHLWGTLFLMRTTPQLPE